MGTRLVRSRFSGLGYLVNDDRASGGKKTESDMLGCGHCQALMRRGDWQEDGGHCSCCDTAVCGPCADRILTVGCESFLRQLERSLNEQYVRSQNARMLCL